MIDYDRFASEYARRRTIHPRVLESLVSIGRINRGSAVLEVGCGTGNYIVALEAFTSCAGWGLDPSTEMLAKARPRSARIALHTGRAEQLGFADS
jgi:ubiquinone/menaquinone biosynthesis C-methylase UbiE